MHPSPNPDAAPPPADPTPPSTPSATPLEAIGLSMGLQHIGARLTAIETRLDKAARQPSGKNAWLEFAKLLVGGWPALGFLFLLLFYVPLRDALNAIPEKVRDANEIGLLGVSLKSTIKAEAARLGAINLSETIPALSPPAIELLLQAPRNPQSLMSYTPNDQREVESIHYPAKQLLLNLSELQKNGLIEITTDSNGSRNLSGPELDDVLAAFIKANPGTEERRFDPARTTWRFTTPLPRSTKLPMLTWQLTELGKKAVDIVLRAVATELAPKAKAR